MCIIYNVKMIENRMVIMYNRIYKMEVLKVFVYKFDVLETLKESGYNTTRLRKEKLLGENAIQSLRRGEMVGIIALEKICSLLDMQPGNIIKYVEDENENIKNNVNTY